MTCILCMDFAMAMHVLLLKNTALRDRIFGAAEHIRNHPDIIASATQSLLMRAENCIAAGGGHFEQLL